MSRKTRAPRRRIERIRTQFVNKPIGTTAATIIVHTAEDSKTLVRLLIQLDLYYEVSNVADLSDSVDLVLNLQPTGVGVVGATLGGGVDQVIPIQEIARWGKRVIATKGALSGTSATETQVWQNYPTIHADISAMRKMKENDIIALGIVAGTNDNSVKIDGNIYAWFKE